MEICLGGLIEGVKRCRRRWLAGGLGAFWAAVALLAEGALHAAGEAQAAAPFFLVSGGAHGMDPLPLKSTRVRAVLVGGFAEVRVDQTYTNEGDRPLEARYVFPGSTHAAVHAMTMTIGPRRIEAQIREKTEARRAYESAKREGRAASLLESHRSNVFEMNVANILPGESVTVELHYSEHVPSLEGAFEWVFPTVVGPRYQRAGAAGEARDDAFHGSPVSQGTEWEPVFTLEASAVGVASLNGVECRSHAVRRALADGRVRVELDGTEGRSMTRDFVLRYTTAGDAIKPVLLVDDWQGERYFLLTIQPPARVVKEMIPVRDYVFVVDISGSMKGFPLHTAKSFMKDLMLGLRGEDSFNLLLFAGGSRLFSPVPVTATPESIAAAIDLLDTQAGGGGTELLPALERALLLPRREGVARSVVVVTDGYIDLEAEAYALVQAGLSEANLFAFGVGSAVNRELIERLARAGRAEPAVIVESSAVAREVARFRAMIESPVLTRVRADLSGLGARDVFPEAPPDVLALRPLVFVGKTFPGARGPIRVEGQGGGGPWRAEMDALEAVDLGGQGLLARLWARSRIERLEDLHALGLQPERQRAGMIELGLRYNLLTRFTSFVAVDASPRGIPASGTVRQPTALPDGFDAGQEVPTTPEPETIGLVGIAAAVAAWTAWKRRRSG